ncbi:MAG: hypothetical protein RL682_840 [Pseudomonadota bacterium]|jgi:ABC-type multidrug transport system fused ATPase/permease subunit
MAQVHHVFSSNSRTGRTETVVKSDAIRKETEGSRTLAGMLLAAVMAALLVAADQVIDTWADGHLLAGWVALWTVAFAALALLAPPLRQVSTVVASMFTTWASAVKLRRQEEAMWEYARRDPRVMAELQSAWTRERDDSLPFNAVPTVR